MTGWVVEFTAPGPGRWELETTHHGLRPLSPFLRDAYRRAFETGITEMLARYGLPLLTIEARLVHGCLYLRPLAIGEKPGSSPPAFVTKLFIRLHPELRRRARTAEQAFTERRWRQEVDQWFHLHRSSQRDANLALQGVDIGDLDEVELTEHLSRALSHFETSARRNLASHGGDMVPTGDLLAHCGRWGIHVNEVAGLLAGGCPGMVESAHLLRPVARAIEDSGMDASSFRSLDHVRALGPDSRSAVGSWLELHAWRTVTSDDVDRPTLGEIPALELSALLGAAAHVDVVEPDPDPVRRRVPAEHRALFDELLAEARYGHRQRDDIRGLCWNWPCGLLRRALLEAGRRLHGDGRLNQIDHVVELVPEELGRMLRGGPGPSATEAAERAAERDRIAAAPPPRSLGQTEAAPSLDVFPKPVARAVAALMTTIGADATPPQGDQDPSVVCGVGIGSAPYHGRACVARDLMLSFDRLRRGDVLVTAFTGPALNSLLPAIGALVVEEGGPMCHAAIVSREHSLPAVIGARGATERIPHGEQVEVDPVRGTVRVLPGPCTSPVGR